MERIERRDTKEEWRLPKNVRQIGEPGSGPGQRILIEDYVYTYLHQMAEKNLTCIRTAVLVGRTEWDAAVYIQGAVEADMGQEPKKWFSHEDWSEIFREISTWFEGQEVVGWYMANPGFPPVLTEELKELHRRHFSKSGQVFFQTDVLDKEEIFYIKGAGGLIPAGGYYIYYEKNAPMQEYMSRKKGGAGIEPEGILKDHAAVRFRNVMQEKREQSAQKKALAFLYTSCMFLVLVIMVIGVTLVNNYDRMTNMEHALHQISESLENEQDAPEEPLSQDSLEAAMEEENRLASAGEAAQTPGEQEDQVEEAASEGAQEPSQEAQQQESAQEQQETSPEVQESVEQPESPDTEEAPEEPQTQEVVSQAVKEPERYRVQKGDTLLEISRSRYGTDEMVAKICEINGLEDGDKIYVGETILLP